MAELTTIARPYAQAIFELAQATDRFKAWSEMLAFAAAVSQDEHMKLAIDSTRFTRPQLAALFAEVCGDQLDEQGRNLVRTLAENRRLALLPEIAAVYEVLRAEAERSIDAQVLSAYPVTGAQQQTIAAALAKRLGRTVRLHISTDKSLLGGAIIRAGDLVIDGSVRGRLAKLASAMGQ